MRRKWGLWHRGRSRRSTRISWTISRFSFALCSLRSTKGTRAAGGTVSGRSESDGCAAGIYPDAEPDAPDAAELATVAQHVHEHSLRFTGNVHHWKRGDAIRELMCRITVSGF